MVIFLTLILNYLGSAFEFEFTLDSLMVDTFNALIYGLGDGLGIVVLYFKCF